MRVLFIRHAEAADRETFQGDDMDRPLTPAGTRSARTLFAALARTMKRPDVIITSEARRCVQTGSLFRAAFGRVKSRTSRALNPGAGIADMRSLLRGLPANVERVALVGHEPDISRMVAHIVARGQMDIRVKKGACVDVEMDRVAGSGELRMLVAPDIFSPRRRNAS